MSKVVLFRAEQVGPQNVGDNFYVFSTVEQNVIAVSITNLSTSGENLLIGLNENPSTKLFLSPGQSMPLGPYRDDDCITDNVINLAFENSDNANRAVIVVSTVAGDKDVC